MITILNKNVQDKSYFMHNNFSLIYFNYEIKFQYKIYERITTVNMNQPNLNLKRTRILIDST